MVIKLFKRSGLKARFFYAAVALLGLIGAACVAYGFFIEPRRLVIKTHTIAVPNLDGKLRIAVASDIHIGGWHVDSARVEALVKTINAQNPDVILLPGDFINGTRPQRQRSDKARTDISKGLQALGDLRAPYGIYYVIGNHDYLYSAREVDSALSFAGLINATDQAIVIDGRLCLFGIDDELFGNPSADGYFDCPVGLPSLALSHSPDSFLRVAPAVSLRIAGHTHGGQVNLPLMGRAVTSTRAGKKWAYGLISDDDGAAWAYVTAGIGTSLLPVRFRSPPEIAILTLQPQN